MKLVNPRISAARAEAGRRGGIAVVERYGMSHMSAIGQRGGRPRLPTLAELEAQHAYPPERQIKRRRALAGGLISHSVH